MITALSCAVLLNNYSAGLPTVMSPSAEKGHLETLHNHDERTEGVCAELEGSTVKIPTVFLCSVALNDVYNI